MQVQNKKTERDQRTLKIHKFYGEIERPKETKETVQTSGDTCKYKIVWRPRRLKRL